MLILKHNRFIVFAITLAILLVQFGALLHAADHPFHQEDVLCISLQSAEQDKHFFHATSLSLYDDIFNIDVEAHITDCVSPSTCSYSSRAPPETAI